jgi:3-hydroxyisobutyrate dehydrogenase-like beta-hydroxyacid dehydrogenase
VTPSAVGFVGIGNMGWPMAANLGGLELGGTPSDEER